MKLTGRLEARQSQQLTMTPQLQQAIKLLQLSNLELMEYVEERLLENPFLETGEGEEATVSGDDQPKEEVPAEATHEDDIQEPVRDRLRETSSTPGQAEDFDLASNVSVQKSLTDVLEEQLLVHFRDPVELAIGRHIVDLIDESGYLTAPTEQIAERLGCPLGDVELVLKEIQTFEPTGVGARNLAECLRLQIEELGGLDEGIAAFLDNLDLLAARKLSELKKKAEMDDVRLAEVISLIKTLNPKPGLIYGGDLVQVVVPDVYVTEGADGGWRVELNAETLPRVIANEDYYASLSKGKQAEESRDFLQQQMSDANWLVRSLDQRARTILKVSSEIIRYQDGFFAYGIRHLRPLNLKTVAEKIGMHESTVSRVTSGKYMHTPRGVFEMKYFFTAAIPSSDGEAQYSAESVRHVIKSLVEAEDPMAPLSDDQLVAELAERDIAIARRTIAKYRTSLKIPSSVERKRLAKQAI